MAETLVQYQKPVVAPDGTVYEARACGGPMSGGMWQGWIEFASVGGGPPVRSRRETTQPNRTDTEYWATGLTHVYLEGALTRALTPARPAAAAVSRKSVFDGTAPLSPVRRAIGRDAVLDPF